MVKEFNEVSLDEIMRSEGYIPTGIPAVILGTIEGSRSYMFDRALQITNAPCYLEYSALAIYHRKCTPTAVCADGWIGARQFLFAETRARLEENNGLEVYIVQALLRHEPRPEEEKESAHGEIRTVKRDKKIE